MDLKRIDGECFGGVELEFDTFCQLILRAVSRLRSRHADIVGHAGHTLNSPSTLLSPPFLAFCIDAAIEAYLASEDDQLYGSVFQLWALANRVLDNRLNL